MAKTYPRQLYPDPELIQRLRRKFIESSIHSLSSSEACDLINHQNELIRDLKRKLSQAKAEQAYTMDKNDVHHVSGRALEHFMGINRRLNKGIEEAKLKAIDSLARYKFQMFGYWAGIWVHLNRISGQRNPNPFRDLVKETRRIRDE